MPDERKPPTVGILYPGEMGAALGRLLADAGLTVVTTLQGRSESTRRRCSAAGLQTLDSLRHVAEASDVVFSLVPPDAAHAVAEQFCAVAPSPAPIFVDANAIAPQTATAIAALLAQRDIRFVDAAIHGLAAHLAARGTLYLSGACAGEVAALFAGQPTVRVLGEEPGRASALKMLIAGVNKGVVALFVEMGVAARELDLDEELSAACRDFYPGVLDVVERLLPTYPCHARRRAAELAELASMMESLDLRPRMAEASRQVIAALGEMEWGERDEIWTTPDVIEAVRQSRRAPASVRRQAPRQQTPAR